MLLVVAARVHPWRFRYPTNRKTDRGNPQPAFNHPFLFLRQLLSAARKESAPSSSSSTESFNI